MELKTVDKIIEEYERLLEEKSGSNCNAKHGIGRQSMLVKRISVKNRARKEVVSWLRREYQIKIC